MGHPEIDSENLSILQCDSVMSGMSKQNFVCILRCVNAGSLFKCSCANKSNGVTFS